MKRGVLKISDPLGWSGACRVRRVGWLFLGLPSVIFSVFPTVTFGLVRSCRYSACLNVGMMPCLVDSCKDQQQQQQQIEKYKAGNVVAQLPRIVAKPKEEIGVIRLSFDKQLAIRKFEKICDDLFFNNPEHYSLIEIGDS